jgi:hypothetical protein
MLQRELSTNTNMKQHTILIYFADPLKLKFFEKATKFEKNILNGFDIHSVTSKPSKRFFQISDLP